MSVSVAVAAAPTRGVAAAGRAPRWVIAGLTARRAVRSGLLWGAVFGAYLATSALGYAAAYPTEAERRQLASTIGANVGVSAIIGPAHAIDTVAGFTAWRTVGVVSIVGAVWGLLLATRLLRGEEEAGRWDLVAAGWTSRRRATAQGLVGIAAGLVTALVLTALFAVAVGAAHKVDVAAGPMCFLALCGLCGAAMFASLGAVASQLATTRRQAASLCAAVLGAAYVLRMVADSGAGLGWLRWTSPLGWVEQLRPLSTPDDTALWFVGALCAAAVVAAVALAGARDVGGAHLSERATARARTALLGDTLGLAVRLTRATALGWVIGGGAMALVLGLVAQSAGKTFVTGSVAKVLARLGMHGFGAGAYLAVGFLIVAVVVALAAAGQATAVRAEEAEGRADNLLVLPVGRVRWLGERLLVALGIVGACALAAGLATWAGAASQQTGLSVRALFEAGANVVPPALVVLGLGALAFALRPRATSGVVYTVVAWSLMVELIGSVVNLNHVVLDTSVFHQMAAVPLESPDWTSFGAMVALGVGASALALVAFAHRDVVGE